MDVTPQVLHDVEFREAKRGGYNTQDVDEFLERLAVGLERLDAQLREARQRAEAAEGRVAAVEQRAAEAERRASETSDADETLKRTLVLAQRTADAAIREAEQQAAATLSAAQEQSSRLLAEAQEASARARAEADAEARRAHEEARARVLAELQELEALRDEVRADVEVLEAHIAHQRERVGVAAAELQRLLDDPEALQELPVPELTEATAPPIAEAEPAYVAERQPLPAPEPAAAEPEAAAPWVEEQGTWGADDGDWEAESGGALFDHEAAPDGPPTQPVDVLADSEPDADDDAYLTELRKAMTDQAPLGPRDDELGPGGFERSDDPGRTRFGRRR